MTEKGLVTKVQGTSVTIRCDGAECASCASCSGEQHKRTISARNSMGLDVSVGDVVEVHVSAYKALRAAFLVLILPLILFLACYALGGWIGIESEPVRALCGVAGIGLGFLVNLALRHIGGDSDTPEISRVCSA